MCNKTFVEIGIVILLIAFVAAFNYGGCVSTTTTNTSGSSIIPLVTSQPSATTLPASDITLDSATLNGLVNPNGLSTVASFQWGTSAGYGFVTPSQSIGNGNSNLNVVASLSGLTFGTTYYFRLRGTNSKGTTYSSGLSFATQSPTTPPLQVASPNPVSGTSGVSILNVQLSWEAAAYAVSYDIYFGTTTSPTYKANITGINYTPDTLAYNTRYYWRIDSKNSIGTTTGNIWNFTTQTSQSPVVYTYTATNISGITVRLNGVVNPMALTTTAYFEWGIAPSYGSNAQAQPQPIGNGLVLVNVYADLSGLLPNTTYNFRLRATNLPFGGGSTLGTSQNFTTSTIPPTITTTASTNILTDILWGFATLNGQANPNGSPTTVYFQYGISPSYTTWIATPISPSIGSGQSLLPILVTVPSLQLNNTVAQPYSVYNFRAVGSSPAGTTYGNVQTLTTRNRPLSLDDTSNPNTASTNYTYGYLFTPTVNGLITALGRYCNTTGNPTIKLWTTDISAITGVLVATVTLASPLQANWQWGNLTTPYSVTAGLYYMVSVDCNSSAPISYPASPSLPVTKGNITILNGDYGVSPAGTFPNTRADVNAVYGWPDIEFLPQQ